MSKKSRSKSLSVEVKKSPGTPGVKSESTKACLDQIYANLVWFSKQPVIGNNSVFRSSSSSSFLKNSSNSNADIKKKKPKLSLDVSKISDVNRPIRPELGGLPNHSKKTHNTTILPNPTKPITIVFSCKICQEEFQTKDSLSMHRKLHKEKKKHNDNLNNTSKHNDSPACDNTPITPTPPTNPISLSCKICQEEFQTKNDLSMHMKLHHEKKKWNDNHNNTSISNHNDNPNNTSNYNDANNLTCNNTPPLTPTKPNSPRSEVILLDPLKLSGSDLEVEETEPIPVDFDPLAEQDSIHSNFQEYHDINPADEDDDDRLQENHFAGTVYKSPNVKHPGRTGRCPHIEPKLQGDQACKYCPECQSDVCDYCSYTFQTQRLFSAHTHKNFCPTCIIKFDTVVSFKQHLTYHKSTTQWKCELCKLGFRNLQSLNIHSRKMHNAVITPTKPVLLSCKICQKEFQTKNYLSMHMKLHDEKKKYPCPWCLEEYITKTLLFFHMHRVHTKERAFKCPQSGCKKGFVRKTDLTRHSKSSVHKTTPAAMAQRELQRHQCNICDKYFASNRNLQQHIKTHLNANGKDFECEICQKRFTQKIYLNLHRTIHENRKPFTCPDCPKSYMKPADLDNHMRNHDPAEFYKKFRISTSPPRTICDEFEMDTGNLICEHCQKPFATWSTLEAHLKTTNYGECVTLICEECARRFMGMKKLIQHQEASKKEGGCEKVNKAWHNAMRKIEGKKKLPDKGQQLITGQGNFKSYETEESDNSLSSVRIVEKNNTLIFKTPSNSSSSEDDLKLKFINGRRASIRVTRMSRIRMASEN